MFQPSVYSGLGSDLTTDAARVVAVSPWYQPGYWGDGGPQGPQGAVGPDGYGIVPVVAAAIIGAGTTLASLIGGKVATGRRKEQEHQLQLLQEAQRAEAERIAARNRTILLVVGGVATLMIVGTLLRSRSA